MRDQETIIFDGKKLAAKKEKILKRRVEKFVATFGFRPKLVAIMVGDNPASQLYLRLKGKTAGRMGIEFEKKEFPKDCDWRQVIVEIEKANRNGQVWGIMVQVPLEFSPKGRSLKELVTEVLKAINPVKDVDCLTPENLGLLMMGQPRFLPATVRAILAILGEAGLGQKLAGKNVCLVGGSLLVGRPLALVLSNRGATVTLCRSKTKNLAEFTRRAEILISATGVPNLIKGDMIRRGAVVIDVGSPKGDVEFEEVSKVSSFITPVPGGVGPMTVISLLENLVLRRRTK